MWAAETEYSGHYPLLSLAHYLGAGLGMERPGLAMALIWDVCVTSSSRPHCVAAMALVLMCLEGDESVQVRRMQKHKTVLGISASGFAPPQLLPDFSDRTKQDALPLHHAPPTVVHLKRTGFGFQGQSVRLE